MLKLKNNTVIEEKIFIYQGLEEKGKLCLREEVY